MDGRVVVDGTVVGYVGPNGEGHRFRLANRTKRDETKRNPIRSRFIPFRPFPRPAADAADARLDFGQILGATMEMQLLKKDDTCRRCRIPRPMLCALRSDSSDERAASASSTRYIALS